MKDFLNYKTKLRISDLFFFGSMPVFLFISIWLIKYHKNYSDYATPCWVIFLTIVVLFKLFNFGKLSKWIVKNVNLRIYGVLIYFIIFILSLCSVWYL